MVCLTKTNKPMEKDELKFLIRLILTEVLFPIIALSAIVFLCFIYIKK
jgi:hypothetical protein